MMDRKLSDIAYSIRESCHATGYTEIFPPSCVRSAKIGGFKFIYRNNVYVLEPDITLRLMKNNINGISRIYYIAPQMDESLNESIKAGLEIIGANEEESNLEIIEMALKILDKLGIKDYNIDISLAGIFNSYKEENPELIDAVRNRNYQQINSTEIENREKLLKIMDTRGRRSGIEKLDRITENIKDSRVIIDPGTVRQPEYYNGLIFEIYGRHGFLGGGGNYKINNMNGCGFSLDLKALSSLEINYKKAIK
jgi:ATP phosphoribosyltransferase regulatory subunit